MKLLHGLGVGILCLALAGCGTSGPSSTGPSAGGGKGASIRVIKGGEGLSHGRAPEAPRVRRQDEPPLAAFFEQLEALEAGRVSTVTVLQLGDSHTAGDRFSGRMRELMQTRFGNAGRGMLPPAVPFDGYRPTQVSVTASGWSVTNSWTSKTPGLFGITGFQAQARTSSSVMAIEPKDDSRFDTLAIGFVRQPGGGTLVIRADGIEIGRIATDGPVVTSEVQAVDPASSIRRFELSPAGDGPVTLLSWTVQRNARGVVWDSQGITSSTIGVMDRWNGDAVARDLAVRNPTLVVLAYGTNEGFGDDLKEDQYTADLTRQITMIRTLLPDAAILLVTPPDGERLPRGCPGASRPDVRYGCAPLVSGDARLHVKGKARGALCRWYSPPKLAMVRAVQAKVAADKKLALWDWSQIMPPVCGAHAWTQANPPLTRGDHVHMTVEGYSYSADAMFKSLMADYDGWRAAKASAPVVRER